MSRFEFELATPADSRELLEILEDVAFTGNIALVYTRRPDAYASFQHEGERVDIVVCRDREQQKIVGFGACAVRTLFVNGRPTKVGYLFGLRTRREYLKKFPILHRGYAFLHAIQQDTPVACYLTTILTENTAAQTLLEKHRACMPTYTFYGTYEVYVLNLAQPFWQRRRRSAYTDLTLRPAQAADLPALIEFLHRAGCRQQFFPVIEPTWFQADAGGGFALKNMYLLVDAHQTIWAAGGCWDQASSKQYLVQGYGGIFKLLAPFSRWLPHIGLPALPAAGQCLNFFTLACWAVKDDQPELFREFLDRIAMVAGTYPFFLVGLHAAHPFRRVLQQRPHLTYTSRVYIVSWDAQHAFAETLDRARPPYLECGLL